MDKEMANAAMPIEHEPVKRLKGTGIKLIVTERETGETANYGVQLNNTTLEIEALPNLKVKISGYQDMYEALKEVKRNYGGQISRETKRLGSAIDEALASVEEK